MFHLTRIDHAALDISHAQAQWFLSTERRRGNYRWFTIGEIFADFEHRPPLIPFGLALKELLETGMVEGDIKGRMRARYQPAGLGRGRTAARLLAKP